ncbi:group II truncated hemoglobin [Amphibiibacter pelophylacis]|uniref:Group II truncated hemoglobin n=1 Tax=Amphibiibacter pelophylacis TaxID=1799477 RepID=A0ACC6P2A6_9BURK
MTTHPTPFERLGGESAVRELVDRFYDLMDLEPVLAPLRALHPTSLDGSRDKLFWFLCGWLGGPAHFENRFGHPRLRARHLPYAIDSDARDQWLACMHQALEDCQVPQDLAQALWPSIAQLADHMRNTPDQPSSSTITAPAPP